MRIKEITIHNIRSFRDQTLRCEPLVTLIGANNAGKSGVLFALEHFFKPSHKLQIEDVCVHRESTDDLAFVEILFGELTEQDQTTYQKYLLNKGGLRVRKLTRIKAGGLEGPEYHGFLEKAPHAWLDPDKAGDYKKREDLPEELRQLVGDGKLSKAKVEEAQKAYVEAHRASLAFQAAVESGPFMGLKNVAAGMLGEFFLLPAVRDLTDETKMQGQTMFQQLVSAAIREMSEKNPEFQKVREDLKRLIGGLNKQRTDVEGARPAELEQLEESIQQELEEWSVTVDWSAPRSSAQVGSLS